MDLFEFSQCRGKRQKVGTGPPAVFNASLQYAGMEGVPIQVTDCNCTRGRVLTRLVRPASVSLLFALALALGLSAVLIAFFAVPAYAQSSTPSVSIRTLQTRMPEGGRRSSPSPAPAATFLSR